MQRSIYLEQARGHKIEPVEARARFSLDDSTRAADELLGMTPPPTAIVCDDDLLAAGAYRAARQRGLAVPRQLSITGFSDIELARVLEPELTTVHIPAKAIGARAARLLVDWIEHERLPDMAPKVELSLVVRGSTAQPASDGPPVDGDTAR